MKERSAADKARINVAKNMTDVDVAFLLKALYKKNHLTYTHSVNVAYLSGQICLQMAMDKKYAIETIKGALLHDIGKLYTPTDILVKKDTLTMEEYAIIKQHTLNGIMIVKNITPALASDIVIDIIENHHERQDGSGYYGKKDNSFFSQLVHAVDIYDSVTADRPYRKACSEAQGIDILKSEGIDKGIINAICGCDAR